jgi:UDP-N-acetylglucosamine 1-carboxyvinyltransferase
VLAGLVAKGKTIVDKIYHIERGYYNLDLNLNSLGALIDKVE